MNMKDSQPLPEEILEIPRVKRLVENNVLKVTHVTPKTVESTDSPKPNKRVKPDVSSTTSK